MEELDLIMSTQSRNFHSNSNVFLNSSIKHILLESIIQHENQEPTPPTANGANQKNDP